MKDHSELLDRMMNQSIEAQVSRVQRDIESGRLVIPVVSREKQLELKQCIDQRSKLQKKLRSLSHNIESIEEELEGSQRPSEDYASFVRRIAIQKKQLEKAKINRKQKEELKAKAESEMQRDRREEQRVMEQQERRQHSEMHRLRLQQQKERRLQLKNEAAKVQKQMQSKTPLHMKMEEAFRRKTQRETEAVAKKLAEIKQIRKPVTLEELKEHEDNYNKQKLKYEQQKELKGSAGQQQVLLRSVYKSRLYRQYDEEVRYRDEERGRLREEEQEKIDKLRKYMNYVKSRFSPLRDEGKARELEQRISKLSKGKLQKTQQLSEKAQREKGKEYLSIAKSLGQRRRVQSSLSGVSDVSARNSERYKNYLVDEEVTSRMRRVQYRERLKQLMRSQNLTGCDKVQAIESELSKINERLAKCQVLARNRSIRAEELDESLFRSVNDKLALLE